MQIPWEALSPQDPLVLTFPGGGTITIGTLLGHTDDGIVVITVLTQDTQQEVTYQQIAGRPESGAGCRVTVYGPHEGEDGHYTQAGVKEYPESRGGWRGVSPNGNTE